MGKWNVMMIRFYLFVCFVVSFQILFWMMSAPSWTFPLSTLLFFLLFSIQFFQLRKSHYYKNQSRTKLYDPALDLDTAKRVQEALLAIDPPETDKVKIVKRCVPATTLGGDFYTFVNKTYNKLSKVSTIPGVVELVDDHENEIGVTIGDVAGHGVSSALVMALASGLLGRIGFNNKSPAVIMQRSNIDIQKFIATSHISHVTAFYGNINLDNLTLTYSNAGHPSGIIIHKDSSYEMLSTDGIFLGMYPDEVYTEKVYQLASGDRILLYTDGIIETINSNREAFGVNRLIDNALMNQDRDIDYVLELVFEQLYKFREGHEQKDDQTLIVIEVK